MSASAYDARVAAAMNRVLEAERSAREAIAQCEQQTQALLEQGRQQRRSILERVHDRIMALHTRVARALETRTAQALEEQAQAPVSMAARGAQDPRLRAAIEKLVERLTRLGEEEP